MKQSPLISLGAGVILLLGIVIVVATYTFNIDDLVANRVLVTRGTVRLDLLFSAVQDVETGQRGFLLTRAEPYLKPYLDSVEAMPDRIKAVDEIFSQRSDQKDDLADLEKLIAEKLVEMKNTIDLAQSGKMDQALAIVDSDHGREIMQEIRTIVARMRDRQSNAVTAAEASLAQASSLLRIGVTSVALGVLVLGIYTFAVKRRQRLALELHARLVEEHSTALEKANRQLTQEIESRHAAEDQIRQMQKIEAVGQLTGGMAHDFNNMLAVIFSALGLAQRRLASGGVDIGRYLDAAIDATNRAATLTKRLLAFSRQQALAPETIDANKMVSDMSELLRRTLGETIRLETVLGGGLWRIHADANQLENSIVNLAVNSRDAMPDGGRITIETANAHLDDVYVAQNAGTKAGQYVLIAVSDTGTGMTPDVVARAFDPFFTTKGVGKGTGLGLSQVYGFVKQSNGHIKIYSEVGQGTTVKLYLPRYFATEAIGARPADAQGKIQGGNTRDVILLVEDEERVRALSMDALQEIGYPVIAADSGRAALQLLEKHPEIVLLFTDIVMPEMSGRVLADAALKMRPDLKVLFTTGFTRNAVVHNGILDPGVNFIPKPFTLDQLAAKVRSTIDG